MTERLAKALDGKRVLVTGGSGFVGTHFVQALLDAGAHVRVPIHHRAMICTDPRVELVPGDITSPDDALRVCRDIEYVVHAAGAVAAAGVTASNPMTAMTTNLVLTARMLEASWTAGVQRFLVFGSSTGYPVTDHPVREDEMWSGPTHPSYFGYGWMRRYLERISEFVASKSQMGIALVRPTAVYGRHDEFDPKTSHVIPALIRRAVAGENPFEVWGTGDEVRDFLHVTDLVRGSLLLLADHAVCDPVNIGYGKTVRIREIVDIILRAAGHKADVVFDATKPTAIPVRMVDTGKAKAVLGFEPSVSLEDGLTDTVRWYTDHGQAEVA